MLAQGKGFQNLFSAKLRCFPVVFDKGILSAQFKDIVLFFVETGNPVNFAGAFIGRRRAIDRASASGA